MQSLSDNLAHQIAKRGTVTELFETPAVRYNCSACEDRGVVRFDVPVEDPRFGKMFPCQDCEKGQQYQLYLWNRRLREVGLPKEYAGLTFATFDSLSPEYHVGKMQARHAADMFAYSQGCYVSLRESVVRAGRQYPFEDDFIRNWLVFQGTFGCAKTGMAAAITNAKMAANEPVLYTRVLDLIENIQRCYSKNYTGLPKEEIVGEYCDASILILDDMNVEIDSDNRKEIMEKIIRYRHDHDLPTVITCNITQKQMEEFWGRRIVSVILGKAHWIPMGGTPVRQELPPVSREAF